MEYNTTYNPNRLIFASDVITTGMTMHNQYVVITAIKKNSSDTLASNDTSGYLILWDGYSVFAEAIIDVPFGAPFCPISNNNILQFVAAGRIYVWAGGDFIPGQFPGVGQHRAIGQSVGDVAGDMLIPPFPKQHATHQCDLGLLT